MPAPFREGRLTGADGLRLCWRHYGARGVARRRPVVCIPGLTRNARDFETLGPHLGEAGHDVYAVDLRGRGRSDHDPKPERYALATYVDDLFELLAHWALEKPAVIGVSLGGLIAMRTEALRADTWSAAVLDDIGPRVAEAGIARLQDYVGREPLTFGDWTDAAAAVRRINAVAFPDYTNEDWMRLARRQCRETDTGAVVFDYDPAIGRNVRAVSASEAAAADLSDDFERLAARPTLVVRGALSDILEKPLFQAMTRKTMVSGLELPRVGHAPTLDEPDAVDAVLRHLARLEA